MTGRRRRRLVPPALLAVVAGAASLVGLPMRPAAATRPKPDAVPATIQVPRDAPTVQAAVDRAAPGTLVLIAPGVYRESVVVTRPDIVIRGRDRNRTILDGQLHRGTAIEVRRVNAVAIENLTARNYRQNGFFWNEVDGYRGSYLTAYRDERYGIYAFGSQHGQIDHSYVSGSADSGFYIGTCRPCHAVVTDVVAAYNAVGFSGTNASGDLFVVRSRWQHNRSGIVPNSLDAEPLPPQDGAVIAGNDVTGDDERVAPSSDEFAALHGVGIALVGTLDDLIAKNRVRGQSRVGIAVAPNPGILSRVWPPVRNRVQANVVERSGTVDLALIGAGADRGNCFEQNRFRTSAPAALERAAPCSGAATGGLATGAIPVRRFFARPTGHPGSARRVPPAPPQPELPGAAGAPPRPATAEPTITVDVARLTVPSTP